MLRPLILTMLILSACFSLFGQTTNKLAPGAPGQDAHWPSAAKNGFGTANSRASKVWFTLNNGVMTEAFYPTLDKPNSQTLQLLVTGESGSRVENEADDTTHELIIPDHRSLSFKQINKAKSGAYTITKTYTTDPRRSTVLIDVVFAARAPGYRVYVYFDPSLNNSGMHDTGWTQASALVAQDANVTSVLMVSGGFDQITSGFLGVSDGLTQLRGTGSIAQGFARAENGNVVQVGRVVSQAHFTIALGFGNDPESALANARASLRRGFSTVQQEYDAGWHRYLAGLTRVAPRFQKLFQMSALVLRALEDKTYRGAMIASPSVPWGGGPNANEPTVSGYHGVWCRDLYHVATAFLAMGDRASAARALDYLLTVQQEKNGSFPQNSWVDGRPIGRGVQMDQVAFPLILAYQLGQHDRQTWVNHLKPAAEFIIREGPATQQDRWEEKPGYSPATIAAEIAGLVCAAHIARANRDSLSEKRFLQVADSWAEKVDAWTATKGLESNNHHYLRITENDNPDDGGRMQINSSERVVDEREVVDAGFLELVRLGIKPAADPLVRRSLERVDRILKVETPAGSGWYRYNFDAYGEIPDGGNYDGRNGIGRLWTLLTGERGEYELALGDRKSATQRLEAMLKFANEGLMLPEQVWDRRESPRSTLVLGQGTGSATPLGWSTAQFIRLALNLQTRHNSETPVVVAARYANNVKQ